ncbi:hypothetical protein JAAARDRAFT_72716 [Jaapia argillacea MUCL 33604]|uniref:Uncharacterized protein n=1 Tax=Jaapia argillacea MUCL 33604 TaxID=933084 RepID=A0A067PSC4_9AGAM|nr:hypothetical protein JAAARDRAFT_72716 [Jaapia argillacea MUCL 33604]
MGDSADMLTDQQRQKLLARNVDVSLILRQQIRAALPTAQDQFLTVMVPGKVLDLKSFDPYDANGNRSSAITPDGIRLREAILCDDMPALGPVQLSPSGKSVMRSYITALDRLIPTEASLGFGRGKASSDPEDPVKKYGESMKWLSAIDPGQKKSHLERYVDCQREYTMATEKKARAYSAALEIARKDYHTVKEQTKCYEAWVAENSRYYQNDCQAAYMKWVVNGQKEKVEYHFGKVDTSTVMSRIENSKETLRGCLLTTDDAAEYGGVRLLPENWASIALKRVQETSLRPGSTPERSVKTQGTSTSPSTEENYWTSVSCSFSASEWNKKTESSAVSTSLGVGVNYGLSSLDGNDSHSSSASAVSEQMTQCDVNISFECMRVDITRPWLHAELFFDHEITTAEHLHLSPGPQFLGRLMDPVNYTPPNEKEIRDAQSILSNRYGLFPMFPTAFILAANVVLEFKGETSSISSALNNSTNSGSASVGYGPFAISTAYSVSTSSSSSRCEITSQGCRITINAPQIIGWVSSMLPALPRLPDDKPLFN